MQGLEIGAALAAEQEDMTAIGLDRKQRAYQCRQTVNPRRMLTGLLAR